MSISRAVDKDDVIHPYSGILLSYKKNETGCGRNPGGART